MADRPSFQFYPGDWKKNQKLRFCSWAARGAWIEILGLMHDSPEYGVLRQPSKSIAQAIGAPVNLINELILQGVMHGCEKGACASFEYQAKHGRTLGEKVELVPSQAGPIWYSPRMVKDEYVRTNRGKSTRFGDDFGDSPKGGIGANFGDAPEAPPNTSPSRRKGDGSSSSSSLKAPPKPPRGGRTPGEVNFKTWISGLPDGASAIPEDHPVWRYASKIGLPEDFVSLEWAWFEDAYRAKPRKKYSDWPGHFRNAVEKGWGHLWWFDSAEQVFKLTTAGRQLQLRLEAEDAQRDADPIEDAA